MSFTFAIKKIVVRNNMEWGKAELKVLSFVTGAGINMPILDELFTDLDEDKKAEVIKSSARSILASKELMTLQNVKDNQEIVFGDTGYALYHAPEAPEAFDWSMLLIEQDDDVRELGRLVDELVLNDEFDGFVKGVVTVAGAAMNPAAVAGLEIAKFIVKRVTIEMQRNKDDQVGLIYQSFVKTRHYPEGEREAQGVSDLSGNLVIDYSIY